ncbi:MAG: kinase [Candidatus Saccharibacteria bacterium]|nr:kinase [Candidatus Saccharibacteria bacterium]
MVPTLYLFVGYPGAGKTTIAQIIAEATGGVHLWADQERHRRFPNPTHSLDESDQLYAELNDEAQALLEAGQTVIFDTNFNFRGDRDKLRAIAEEAGAETCLLWIATPEEIAKERATNDQAAPRNGYSSPMSPTQFSNITCKLETPDEDEQPIIIDGTNVDKAALLQWLNLN